MPISIEARLITTTFLILAVLGSAMGVVYTKHLNRKYYSQLQQIKLVRDEKIIEWGQWQLERSTFGTSSQIEQSAREKLGMKQPVRNELEIIRP